MKVVVLSGVARLSKDDVLYILGEECSVSDIVAEELLEFKLNGSKVFSLKDKPDAVEEKEPEVKKEVVKKEAPKNLGRGRKAKV